ncbi:transcriptional regulator [Klebsiella quasipneumoniae]|uniref:transcriptional regulator n=1 Tax=Klebsiella quasipneumoniae TaxID=1463165 RepID=UPI00352AB3B5
MSNRQIEKANAVSMRIRAALGCDEVPKPYTTENVSRARLLRVSAGLCHVLIEIVPGIAPSKERDELYAWLFEIHSIIGAEECSQRAEAEA